jgi:hypothetical protein
MEKILFLDIDGVLNDHAFCEVAQSCTIKPQCMGHLNQIIHSTGCSIVLTSAWRYIIHGGDMTLKGFEYMLRTHGLLSAERPLITGVTRKDRNLKELQDPRAVQVLDWVKEAESCGSRRIDWAILDDGDFGFSDCEICAGRFVRTNGTSGLNHVSAKQVIDLLI